MGLPVVSMEDEELFPKNPELLYESAHRHASEKDGLNQFLSEPNQLWWSRLVISCRGYVVNLLHPNEEQMFSLDDCFTLMHKVLAERQIRLTPINFVRHLNTFFSVPNVLDLLERIDPVNSGYLEPHPFAEAPYRAAFEALFGNPESAQSLHTANMQKLAYDIFTRLLGILLARYNANSAEDAQKRRGIRFANDPDWQPDDRVVYFKEFYQGNRTWILSDFDRHILEFWKPNGVQVIFGDRYIEKKQRAGFLLCDYCGMLEQKIDQFPQYQGKRWKADGKLLSGAMDHQRTFKKPTKAICRKALDEVIPDLIQDQNYSDATVEFLTNKIMQTVATKFKELQYEHYKFIFHVIMTEERGQGLRAHAGCYWDIANDMLLAAKYINKNNLCCHVTVFAVILY
ncbi:hypothetical protein M3Y95_00404900 [Aphelenchoides besseyi]|nr:hypothetical protein M3Y95_00404900 [Aphelenchoides besseyi]